MSNDFIYTTYIKSTPEKVWQAITNPEFSSQYWGGHVSLSDWKKGSKWTHEDANNNNLVRIAGKVLESNPPTRLVVTWATPDNKEDESQVAFDIAMAGDMVRLDVMHTKLSADMGSKVSGGWPLVLSSMKSFLETGNPIDIKNVKKCA